jgi:lysophospholipase L1-like esterase
LLACAALAGSVLARGGEPTTKGESFDVVVYGGTSAGVMAAVQSARMGKTVVLIEPTRRLGGMTSGGLGATDVGREAAIGGLAREFYQRIAQKYRDDRYWTFQKREEYVPPGPASRASDRSVMWAFEPKVALEVFEDLIREHKIPVHYGERLELKGGGVKKVDRQIVEIAMESGAKFGGKMFIDASYEGDVMAGAGVSYAVGRESSGEYGESLNGITTKYRYAHERPDEIDANVIKGDPSSGLLPSVLPRVPADGTADRGIMASCFRMCLTNHPANRIPIAKPADYNERNYELFLRSVEAGRTSKFYGPSPMPNGKTDCNSTEPFSTNYVGMNHDYPDADHARREKIILEHKNYQLGFMWTLQHHPRVPAEIRRTVGEWGLPKDEFTETGHWSPQLYIREGRRMKGELVMIQLHCEGGRNVPEPVGMGSYTMDSHYVQRFVDARGVVRHEGNFDRRIQQPYGIGYRALVPLRRECENLLVPVCLSASHVAYGSIRMEPVFMILGQSAATAACLAIDDRAAVQAVSYVKLRARLLADQQVLGLPGQRAAAAPSHPSFAAVRDVPGLPRVLLIGDSISMGYTLDVRAGLAGVANVHRPPANCNSSGYGLAQLSKWLGDGKWDVIHFNFGIHDAKLPPEGKLHSSLEVYEKNLREIVRRLRASGAKLVWATSTPIPMGGMLAPDRRFGDIAGYNERALMVMKENGVVINDLNATITPHIARVQIQRDVHFTPEGSGLLARQTAAVIKEQLRLGSRL